MAKESKHLDPQPVHPFVCESLCACVFVCTHRHWALEMLEGNAVTPKVTWQDGHQVCLPKLWWNPGLMSISEPRAEAAAVFIITISSIISVITSITSVCLGPQSGFTFLVCLLLCLLLWYCLSSTLHIWYERFCLCVRSGVQRQVS